MRNNFAVKNRLVLIFLFIFTLGLFASGSNEKPAPAPQEVFEKVVYTDADRKRMEIKNIEKLSEEKTPLALWRSYLMLRSLPDDKEALDLYGRMVKKWNQFLLRQWKRRTGQQHCPVLTRFMHWIRQ